jgi:ABC-2 type transport system permease protein
MFPFDGMPVPAQHIAEILPLTHFVRMIRAIVLRSASIEEVATELIPLALFFAFAIGLAVARFRKRLD